MAHSLNQIILISADKAPWYHYYKFKFNKLCDIRIF
jgi:hypothetical protein